MLKRAKTINPLGESPLLPYLSISGEPQKYSKSYSKLSSQQENEYPLDRSGANIDITRKQTVIRSPVPVKRLVKSEALNIPRDHIDSWRRPMMSINSDLSSVPSSLIGPSMVLADEASETAYE
ncbi:hypothetical protein Tco_0502782 [Tanacetum coccineum]|uniref:Uncharacterized protein n=1 Tax=Tanacetum coccineum TaxID=301880 RepID=A0ABQ5CCH4_9ASTR